MKWLGQVRSALITAVVVFVAMQFLVAIIHPYIPFIIGIIILITLGWLVYGRATRL